MKDKYMCGINNKIDVIDMDNSTFKCKLNLSYDTVDPDTKLSEEETSSLVELVEESVASAFRDVVTVFPEIKGLDINIYRGEDNSEI